MRPALCSAGSSRVERVAVWAPNIPEWIVLEFAAALARLTLVTVNPAFRSEELGYVLRQSRAPGLVLVPEYRGNSLVGFLDTVRPQLPDLREVVLFSDWPEFCASGSATERLPVVRPDDPAQIQYTSGTERPPLAGPHRRRRSRLSIPPPKRS